MCAHEQGKFWAMHDKIFENQRAIEDANLESYAQAVGLNMSKWKSCFSENKYKAQIDEDQRTATTLGARGTPAFFINGRFLSGAQPVAAFEAVVDEELKKAKASGVARSEYYQKEVVDKGAKSL